VRRSDQVPINALVVISLIASGVTSMKRSQFSARQIIGIVREYEAGLSAVELCRRTALVIQRFTIGARSIAAWTFRKPSG
jgi:hypothetical protein